MIDQEHAWYEIRFAGWTHVECVCGFHPADEEEYNSHQKFMQD